MLIDTHAHLDEEQYNDVRELIIEEAQRQNVGLIINPGIDLASSMKSIDLAKEYSMIYSAVGVHPHDVKDLNMEDYIQVENLAKHLKVVGIGEIGLDYYYEYSPKALQIMAFEKQIEIAEKMDLPIIIHSREAHQDTYNILKGHNGLEGVMHSFSGSWEMAEKYLDLGFYISFSGSITFKNARKLPEVAEKVPLDRLVVETDSPYLTPVPYRGKRNHPCYVEYVVRKICEIRCCSYAVLLNKIEKNVHDLFKKLD
ncbi:MAG: TatD family hydrolase [Eubacteriales bacterium]